jgi:hypothetical protein
MEPTPLNLATSPPSTAPQPPAHGSSSGKAGRCRASDSFTGLPTWTGAGQRNAWRVVACLTILPATFATKALKRCNTCSWSAPSHAKSGTRSLHGSGSHALRPLPPPPPCWTGGTKPSRTSPSKCTKASLLLPYSCHGWYGNSGTPVSLKAPRPPSAIPYNSSRRRLCNGLEPVH